MLLNLQNLITSCEIPDTADNHGCRFWNIHRSCDFANAQITAHPLDKQNLDS